MFMGPSSFDTSLIRGEAEENCDKIVVHRMVQFVYRF